MTVKIRRWESRDWRQPNVEVFRDVGDFYSLTHLLPDVTGRKLKRAAAWGSYTTLAGSPEPHAQFYGVGRDEYVGVGEYDSKLYAFDYDAGSVWIRNELTDAVVALGGIDYLNVWWWGGHMYVIGSDGKVYRGPDYWTNLTPEFYGTADAQLLTPHGDRMYMVTTAGVVKRVNDADTAFETFYTPLDSMDVRFATSFRGYLILFVRATDGTMVIYRLTSAATLHHVISVPSTGNFPDNGLLFAHHDDMIYFCPGRVKNAAGHWAADIYRFDGSRVRRISQQPDVAATGTERTGLLAWRDRLLFYTLDKNGANSEHEIKLLVGDEFTDFITLTADAVGVLPHLASLRGDLYLTADGTAGATTGFYKLVPITLQDGHLVTSWLDMGHPGRPKRLHRIAVHLDGHVANFQTKISHRVDDTAGWTLDSTSANTRRATALALGVEFYMLQIKVELDDNTGANKDFAIEAVACVYSVDE